MELARTKKVSLFPIALACAVLGSVHNSAPCFAGSNVDSTAGQTIKSVGESTSEGTNSSSMTPAGTDAASSASVAASTSSTTGSSSSSTPETSSSTSTTSSPSTSPSTQTPPSSQPTATSSGASTGNSETAPGPLLDKRKLVLSRIMAAKKQGTGISGYLAEYGRIEEMVKSGQPTTAYAERLDSLMTGIDEQLKRSQLLKTQRPTGSFSPSSSSSSSNASSGHGGGGGGGISSDTIDQLQRKYGDKVPPNISDKIGNLSPEQREKLLNSDMLKKFLNK